ncbi:hypothetical protein EUX98_g895 [Antrodiella citrinella]|uniref:Ribonuclease T2-like n=1 Tax=Antrodiella citrinella TaxID=2447956 RepID=A0A4S4N2Q5_9APHY|nr:hypothetical protein EUX98_g895 [Antrodiella citrinella]
MSAVNSPHALQLLVVVLDVSSVPGTPHLLGQAITMLQLAYLAPLIAGVVHATAVSPRATVADSLLDLSSLLPPGFSKCGPLNDILSPISCQNTTVQQNTCCFNAPGGHFLQTQFWDFDAPVQFSGPADSWTVHGLWPDHCDGSFDEFCSPERESTNITGVLEFNKEFEILAFMKKFWTDDTGNDESFWEHEWNKHGTCMSTLEPQCILGFNEEARTDIIIFLKRTIGLYQNLNTFEFLERKNIVPTTTKTYKFADVLSALVAATGKTPTVQCDGTNNAFLNELWYHFETKGSVVDGIFLHADPDPGSDSNCPEDVYYWPKGAPLPTPSPTSTSAAPSPTSTEDKGTIQVYTATGSNVGCILSKGTWSQQTCATFRPTLGSAAGSIQLTSSKGPCAVNATDGTLDCASGVTDASDFSNSTISTGSLLAFNGSSQFSADVLPTGQVQSPVFVDGTHPQAITLVYTRV